MNLSADEQRALLDYARAVIRDALRVRQASGPEISGPSFGQIAGCFVTLHSCANHRLRGCIGQIQATQSLKDSVREMAQATLQDPRFCTNPVTAEELAELDIEITIISPLEPAATPLDFDLLEHGIYLRYAGRAGCFLPQVARETGWTREQLLARLCEEKMDVPADSWKRPEARLLRFTATIVGPEKFDQ